MLREGDHAAHRAANVMSGQHCREHGLCRQQRPALLLADQRLHRVRVRERVGRVRQCEQVASSGGARERVVRRSDAREGRALRATAEWRSAQQRGGQRRPVLGEQSHAQVVLLYEQRRQVVVHEEQVIQLRDEVRALPVRLVPIPAGWTRVEHLATHLKRILRE